MKKSLLILFTACFALMVLVVPPVISVAAAGERAKGFTWPSKPLPLEVLEANARKEGALTLYGYTFTGEFSKKLKAYWWDRYKIKITSIGGGSSQTVEKFKAEAASGRAFGDGAGGALFILYAAKDAGVLQKIDHLLPELQKYPFSNKKIWPVTGIGLGGWSVSAGVTALTLLINTDLVPPSEEPKSYKDLLNPKWKGKIVLADLSFIGLIYYQYLLFGPEGTNELPIEYWKALGDQVVVLAGHDECQERVAKGEFAISLDSSQPIQAKLYNAGAPIKALELKEGTPAAKAGDFIVAKNAPHPYAALLYANWVVSKEGAKFYAENRPQVPLRTDVEVRSPMPRDIISLPLKKLVEFSEDNMSKLIKYKRDKVLPKLWGKTR